MATNRHLFELISKITSLAKGAKVLNSPFFKEYKLEMVKIVCSSTVYE